MYRSVNDLGKVAHNSFLSVAVELGVIGGLLFVGILGMAAVQAWSQPTRDARFWLTMLLVWSIGASSLTWEYRKPTWLFIGLCAVSAALGAQRGGGLRFAPRGGSLRGHSLAGP
jgi:O-antigen ligase